MEIKPITENEWRGLTLQQAIEKANTIGYIWRIVEENGKALMLTYDNKSNRVNLRLNNNIVIGLYTGQNEDNFIDNFFYNFSIHNKKKKKIMKHKFTSFQKRAWDKIKKLKEVDITQMTFDGDLVVIKSIPAGFVVITVFPENEISLEYNYYDGTTVIDFFNDPYIILTLD